MRRRVRRGEPLPRSRAGRANGPEDPPGGVPFDAKRGENRPMRRRAHRRAADSPPRQARPRQLVDCGLPEVEAQPSGRVGAEPSFEQLRLPPGGLEPASDLRTNLVAARTDGRSDHGDELVARHTGMRRQRVNRPSSHTGHRALPPGMGGSHHLARAVRDEQRHAVGRPDHHCATGAGRHQNVGSCVGQRGVRRDEHLTPVDLTGLGESRRPEAEEGREPGDRRRPLVGQPPGGRRVWPRSERVARGADEGIALQYASGTAVGPVKSRRRNRPARHAP